MVVVDRLPEKEPRLDPQPSLLELLCPPSDGDEPVSPELALVASGEERQRLLEGLPEPSFDEWVTELRRRFEADHAAQAEVEARPARRPLSRRERIAGVLVMGVLVVGSALPIVLHALLLR